MNLDVLRNGTLMLLDLMKGINNKRREGRGREGGREGGGRRGREKVGKRRRCILNIDGI